MALQGSLTTDDGVTHSVAYARIVEANLNWADSRGRIVLNVYHDQASRDAGKAPVKQVGYDFGAAVAEVVDADGNVVTPAKVGFADVYSVSNLILQGENIIKITYDHVKTYADWAGWLDV